MVLEVVFAGHAKWYYYVATMEVARLDGVSLGAAYAGTGVATIDQSGCACADLERVSVLDIFEGSVSTGCFETMERAVRLSCSISHTDLVVELTIL